MIALRDIKIVLNKKYVAYGFISGILGILSPVFLPQYGIFLSILFFTLSYFIAIYTNSFQKDFEGEFKENVTVKDSMSAVLTHNGKSKIAVDQ